MEKYIIKSKGINEDLLGTSVIHIFTTHQCNYNCEYCSNMQYKNDNKINNKFLNIESLKLVLNNIKDVYNGQFSLYFTGGEPTLHPKMLDILQLVSNNECIKYVGLVSNGSADVSFYKKMYELLPEKLLLHISYHPSNPLSINHYLKLFNEIKDKKFIIAYMVDDKYSIEEHLNNLEKFKDYKIDINALEPHEYTNEFKDFINKKGSELHHLIKIEYNDGSEDIVTPSKFKEINKDKFKGMYCESFQNFFILNKMMDMEFSSYCSSKYKCNPLFKKQIEKFFKNINKGIMKCESDICTCHSECLKWKD